MTYYRYEDGINYNEESEIGLWDYEVIKETKCGVWIRYPEKDRYLYNPIEYIQGKKFILERTILGNGFNTTPIRKRFAWPTKELALISYIARKEKQVAILEYKLENAKKFLIKAKEMQNKENK
jgi:hypothetical protein